MADEPIKWEPMTRAWLLIKLKDDVENIPYNEKYCPNLKNPVPDNVPDHPNRALAKRIFEYFARKYPWEGKNYVIRVDVVSGSGPYDLIAPVYTADDYCYYRESNETPELDDIEAYISSLDEVLHVHRSVVDQHVPDPSWDTAGFITYQEERSPKRGPTSHRPW